MTDLRAGTPAQRLREAYALWSASKGATSGHWLDLLGHEIEMRTVLSSDLPDDLAATRFTKLGAMEYFQTVARDWEMLDFQVHRFVDGGDDVVMVGRCAWRNRTTGKVVDTPKVDVWRFSQGKAVSFLEMFDSLAFVRAIPTAEAAGVG
jgi:ketosteroid isomerase-like protein